LEGGDGNVNAADAILVLHGLLVLFNVGVVPLIWIGHFRGWAFVRNFYFRIVHLLLIAVVAAESVFGVICPLTTWEDALRSSTGAEPMHESGFIAHWLHQLLFYDFPAWVFTVAYVLFFLLVVFTLYWVRPQLPGRARQ
jgi:polyferredoxin